MWRLFGVYEAGWFTCLLTAGLLHGDPMAALALAAFVTIVLGACTIEIPVIRGSANRQVVGVNTIALTLTISLCAAVPAITPFRLLDGVLLNAILFISACAFALACHIIGFCFVVVLTRSCSE